MNKNWLKILVAVSAIAIAGSAAFFSVTGLGVLFSGAAVAVMIMAGSLEFAKLVTATYLKQEWDNITGINKWYLTSAVVILMGITSAGIFGYLSNAFQQQNLKLDQIAREISVWDNKIKTDSSQIVLYTNQLNQLQENNTTVLNKNTNRSSLRFATSTGKEQSKIRTKISVLNDSIVSYNTHINDIKNANIGIEREVGGFRFVAESFGVPLNSVVKFFIILIVIVFDPLAVALIIAFNGLINLGKKEEPTSPTTDAEIEAKDLMAEVSRIRLSEDDLKKLEEALLNPPKPNDALIKAKQAYDDELYKDQPPAFTTEELLAQIMESDEELGLYDEPTLTPTPEPTSTPIPTSTPEPTPTPEPTETPTPTPTYLDNVSVRSNGGNFFNTPAEGYTPDTLGTVLFDEVVDNEPITQEEVTELLNDIHDEIISEEPTSLESPIDEIQEDVKKKLIEDPQEDLATTISEETLESQDFKENLYWESDDINPNQVIYDLENNQVIVPTSEEEIIEPTPIPPPVNKILTRNVNPKRRNFR